MKKFHSIAHRIPTWLPTVLAVGLLLWLTLASKPLGDNHVHLFPGADKVAHMLMFGGTAAALLFDIQKHRGWRPLSLGILIAVALALSLLGVAIEFAQEAMGAGSSFEEADMSADALGAFTSDLLWIIFQKYWSIKTDNDGGN